MIFLRNRRRLSEPLVVLTAAVWALVPLGCGGGGSDAPLEATGVYDLIRAAGQNLPATVLDMVVTDPSGSGRLRVVVHEGELTLAADGTYSHRVRYSATWDGAPLPGNTFTDRGGYTRNGDAVQFESSLIQNRRYSGVLSQSGLTIDVDIAEEGRPASFEYVRRR